MINLLFLFIAGIYCDDVVLQRPEPDKIMKIISELDLSEKQRQDIEEELYENLKKYDKLKKKYDKKIKEKDEIEKEIETLKKGMIEANKNVTVIIKSFLTEEQNLKFADIIKKQKEKLKEKGDVKEKEEKKVESDDRKSSNNDNQSSTTSPFAIYFP